MSGSKLLAGFKKVNITPGYPVRLAGYFNERISEGVLDPLFLRLAALRSGEKRLLFIEIDNCAIRTEDAEEIRGAIAHRSSFQKHEIMLFTSHIHTGPDLVGFFDLPRDERYLNDLKSTLVKEASSLEPEMPVSVSLARANYEGLAFNRRWFMEDGRVVTNPPKKSPGRRKPEGSVDRQANSIIFMDMSGDKQALFVNISNHTDAVGGSKISADWPGFMERCLNESLGMNAPVFVLLAPQGNINHLEFEEDRPQSSYEEAARLGRAYARIVSDALSRSKPVRLQGADGRASILEAKEIVLEIPSRAIAAEEFSRAKEILSQKMPPEEKRVEVLTAEDLAKGHPTVERIFARELIRFAEIKPKNFSLPLQTFKLGPIAFAAIPGEPFVEVGLSLKTFPGYELVVPVALANGYFGYIPLQENFGRGGYETRTGFFSCLSPDAADRILVAFRSLLRS